MSSGHVSTTAAVSNEHNIAREDNANTTSLIFVYHMRPMDGNHFVTCMLLAREGSKSKTAGVLVVREIDQIQHLKRPNIRKGMEHIHERKSHYSHSGNKNTFVVCIEKEWLYLEVFNGESILSFLSP